MIIGGSTTALLSFMNSLDSKKYNVDLQLLRNEGPLLDAMPEMNYKTITIENNYVSIYNAIVRLIKNKKLLNQMKETLKRKTTVTRNISGFANFANLVSVSERQRRTLFVFTHE